MATTKTAPACPVQQYARDVLAGKHVAGRLVRLTCERHLRDLDAGDKRGLTWDAEASQHAIDFFRLLKHSKGEWAGKPLTLSPWQQFIVGSLFGWKRADGTRRFRMAYDELARKNGKSTMAAGVGLYLAFFSGEPGAEVYTAATKLDQAKIVHSEAIRMVKANPGLKRMIAVYRNNLSSEQTNSKYEPLGSDSDTQDGLNPNGVIVDELHAHKTRDLLDVLETATGSRREPLIFIITTAGVAATGSVCQEMHDYAVKVLEGQLEDDSLFVYIATIDVGDSWEDPNCWAKANPNLGVSCKLDDLERKAAKAREMPSAQATFRQKHLDEWVQALEVWLPDASWMRPPNADPIAEEDLVGRRCFGGLDLANTLDLAAWVKVFPRGKTETFKREPPEGPEGEQQPAPPPLMLAEAYDVELRCWVPEAKAEERERTHKTNYRTWIAQGLITVTDGDVTDYDVIRQEIGADGKRYQVLVIAFDPWNATQIANQLTLDGFASFRFTQSMANYAEPMQVLEKLAKEGRLRHGGNPLLRWAIGNVVAVRNGLGHAMPSRKKSADKIDPVCALLMALSQAILDDQGPSVYESQGIQFF